ncbi:adenylate/guanylate cyclase domain-containing protein [Desulfosarcina cetonica]
MAFRWRFYELNWGEDDLLLKNGRWRVIGVGLVVTAGMMVLYLFPPGFLTVLNHRIYDALLQASPRRETTGIPVIVDLDERSLQRFGQWPWPRYRVAALLEKIHHLGAEAVGVDIIFAEPDRTSPRTMVKDLHNDLSLNVSIYGLPDELMDFDRVLADALARGPFVLAYKFFAENADMQSSTCRLYPLRTAILAPAGVGRNTADIFTPTDVVCTIPVLAEAAGSSGFINIAVDEDGIYRKVPLIMRWNGAFYPSLALATLMRAHRSGNIVMQVAHQGLVALRIGTTTVPVDPWGQLLIRYRGPSPAFPHYSAADILDDAVPGNRFKGKIVFIGASAAGLKDNRATPFDPTSPGVEVHATVLDNLLRGDFLSHPQWATGAEFCTVFLSGVIATLLLFRSRARWSVMLVLLSGTLLWAGSTVCMMKTGVFISPMWALLTLGACFVALTVVKFWHEESEKRFFYTAFSHYVSGSVVNELVCSHQGLSLDGEEKTVSILFADLRGFSTLSEKLAPNQVSELLRACFTPLSRLVIESAGTMDKFIGDAMMAFWNAPVDVPQHAPRALDTALAMLDAMDHLNIRFRQSYGFNLELGIGLHSGLVRVGNMGSADLFDYTVIGDTVNLASRLEGLTRTYGLPLLVSETIRRACDGDFIFQEIDTVRVKGKHAPTTLYTAYRDGQKVPTADELTAWDAALALYRQRRFTRAATAFEQLGDRFEDRTLYRIYARRCMEFSAQPPGEAWDGVFVLNHK